MWRQKDFHALLPKQRVHPREATRDVSKSKTKGHSCELLLPRKSFYYFFFKGMKAKLPYSLASFTKKTRVNNFHSLTLFFPSKEISPYSKEEPFEVYCILPVHLVRRSLTFFFFLTPFCASMSLTVSR